MGLWMKKEELLELKKRILELNTEEKKERDLYLREIAIGNILGPMTGYASIDKPWLKYYSKENIAKERDDCSAYDYMYNHNVNNLSNNAINYVGNIITYKSLFDKIEEVMKSLIALGVKKGDVVTLIMANIPENIYLFYGINRLGAIANIIDPRLKDDEICSIINEVNSDIIFTIDTFMNKENINMIKKDTCVNSIILVNPLNSARINKMLYCLISNTKNIDNTLTWEEFVNMGNDIKIDNIPKYTEELPAVMVRTGGTTGKPKTVILPNRALNEIANQHILGEYNFSRNDTFLNFLPPFIAYGICGATHMPLVLGLENILIPSFDAKEFPKLMKKYSPNVVFGGPILYENMMHSKKTRNIDLSYFKVPVSGGDTMNTILEQKVNNYLKDNNCNHNIGQGYGMTEVSSSVCYSKENSYILGSVGIPLINNVISIFDEDTLDEKQIGSSGEICIKTDTTMLGYFKNAEENAKILRKHNDGSVWIHTGDIGKMNYDGNLFVIGRIKRIIVSNGSKIYPTEIEKIINNFQSINSCIVVSSKHKTLRNVPVAHIVLTDKNIDKEKLVMELDDEIKRYLPDYYLPYIYVFRDSMPFTSINKVDYKLLEEEEYSYKNRINEVKKLVKKKVEK